MRPVWCTFFGSTSILANPACTPPTIRYALLRYGDRTIEVKEGDVISFPHGERIAHQFYNHTDEPVDILMVGENLPYEACYYPDSDKWLSRSMGKVGKFESTDYWADEPDPPVIKAQE